jgi:hypothetical protein
LAGALTLAACQSAPASQAAVLSKNDPQTMQTVEAVLARAMDRARVTIGPGDLTKMSTIAVLPPRLSPLEDRSPAKPALFDIVLKDGACFVVRREDGASFPLADVSCLPVTE